MSQRATNPVNREHVMVKTVIHINPDGNGFPNSSTFKPGDTKPSATVKIMQSCVIFSLQKHAYKIINAIIIFKSFIHPITDIQEPGVSMGNC